MAKSSRTVIKPIIPRGLRSQAFADAWSKAAHDVVQGMMKDFKDATLFFKDPPVWRTYVKQSKKDILMSVTTKSVAFRYYDQGNGGPNKIIYPKRSKVLHWVDKSGDDVFVAWVHGYEGRKVTETVRDMWTDKMYDIFGKYLAEAAEASGHKI